MEQDFVLNCRQNEFSVDGKCIPFDEVEREVKSLIRIRKRSAEQDIRLALLYKAMKDYLDTLKEMEDQINKQKTYVSQMVSSIYSWWYGQSSSDDDSSKRSGAHITRRRRYHHSKSSSRKGKHRSYRQRRK